MTDRYDELRAAAEVFTMREEIVQILIANLSVEVEAGNQIEGHDVTAEALMLWFAALTTTKG